MKKIAFLLLFTTICLLACSKDGDESSNSNTFFFEINVLNETYKSENSGEFGATGMNELSCDFPDEDDIMFGNVLIPYIENSTLSCVGVLYHYESQNYFKNYNINNTKIIEFADYDYNQPEPCFDNLDFAIDFYLEDEGYLEFYEVSDNFHKIDKIKILKETNQKITYVVEGEFKATFKSNVGNLIPIYGKYRTLIYVLN